MFFYYIHIVTCIFIIEIVHVLIDFTKTTCIQGDLRVCCKCTQFQVLMKGAPPWLWWQEKLSFVVILSHILRNILSEVPLSFNQGSLVVEITLKLGCKYGQVCERSKNNLCNIQYFCVIICTHSLFPIFQMMLTSYST